MFNRKIASAAFLAGIALVQAPAQAVDAQVIYKAHELNSPTGQKAVVERIRRNVDRACSREYNSTSPYLARGCKRTLGDQIVAKIGDPMVTALWQGRDGQALASRSR